MTVRQFDVIIEHMAKKELGTNDPLLIAAAIEGAKNELDKQNAIEIEGRVVAGTNDPTPN